MEPEIKQYSACDPVLAVSERRLLHMWHRLPQAKNVSKMTKYIKNTPEYEISATFDRNRQYHSTPRNIPYPDAVSYEKDDAACEKTQTER